MKFKATKSQIMNTGDKIICVGYCDLQSLLSVYDPMAYTSGVYGWNSDIYHIDGIYIVTGYRPFGNIRPDYKTVDRFNLAARKVNENYSLSYEERKHK
jgi:hypothetical protein